MIRRFFIIFCLTFLTACNDGDILTVDLDFDKELERCENNNASYLIYDLRNDPNESLSLIIPRTPENELLFTSPTPVDSPVELTIDGNNVRFIYRTYNRAVVSSGTTKELCAVVPPANLNIVENYEASTGKVFVTVTIEDDDNDGIPSYLEYGPGGIENPQDTDGDGIPDYIDQDDDNDNVLTRDEIYNSDNSNDPTVNPIDTDGDGVPDYLDDDDDGDGIKTYLEDKNGEQNPRSAANLVVDEDGNNVYRYLYNHPMAMEAFPDPGKRPNTYTRTVTTSFTVTDIDLEILRTTIIEFGTLISVFEIQSPINN